MDKATLHGIRGVGELHEVRSPDNADAQPRIKGLWTLLDAERLEEVLTLHESEEVVTYIGPVSVLDDAMEAQEERPRQAVQVRIQSLDTSVDEQTGRVQATAHLYGVGTDAG